MALAQMEISRLKGRIRHAEVISLFNSKMQFRHHQEYDYLNTENNGLIF